MSDAADRPMSDAMGIRRAPAPSLVVWLGATRYYLGRMSCGPASFAKELRAAWRLLDDATRRLIERDVEEAFRDDDRLRLAGTQSYYPLGRNCDRATWEEVRTLWTK